MMARPILVANFSGQVGGAERSLLTLATTTMAEMEVACPPEGDLVHLVESIPRRVHRVQLVQFSLRRLPGYLKSSWHVFRLIRQVRPRLIHCNTYLAPQWFGLPALLLRVPLILHMRDMRMPGRFSRVLLGILRHYGHAICISEAVRARMCALGLIAPKRSSVVYNGVQLEKFERLPKPERERLRREWGLGSCDLVIAMIGRVEHWKRPGDFLEVAKKLASDRRFGWLMVGDSSAASDPTLADRLRDRAQAEGIPVTFLPFQKDVERIFGGIDILVVPSEEEPFGRVAIEAMACEVPVIGTNQGGLPEIITDGDAGYLVEVGDVMAIASCLTRLVNDAGLLTEMRDRARQTAVNRFSEAAYVKGVEAIYASLAP